MIPTPRLLIVLLIGAALVAGVAIASAMLWLALIYLLVVGILIVVDVQLTTRSTDLEVERICDNRLSLGAENLVTLLIANRSARQLTLTVRDEYPYTFQTAQATLTGAVAGYGLCELQYHLRPLQRGDYRFGDINIRYQSFLRTFIRQARYPASADSKVYPNVLDIRKYDLLARKGLLVEIGLRAARIYGQGSEFERLREYTTDDEFRRINWKATARRGKPIAAEYETERSQYVLCVIDTGRMMRPPVGDLSKLDYVINAALLLAYVVNLKGDHVGLLTFADDVRTYLAPKRGKGQFYRMLEALYNIQYEPVEADYARGLTYLATRHKRRSLVVIFTDLVTLDAAKPLIAHLTRLARHHLPLCVVISDPNISGMAEQSPNGSVPIYQRAVAEMLLAERRVVLDTLQRSGVHTIDVPADQLSVAVINKYLELKGRGAI